MHVCMYIYIYVINVLAFVDFTVIRVLEADHAQNNEDVLRRLNLADLKG